MCGFVGILGDEVSPSDPMVSLRARGWPDGRWVDGPLRGWQSRLPIVALDTGTLPMVLDLAEAHRVVIFGAG